MQTAKDSLINALKDQALLVKTINEKTVVENSSGMKLVARASRRDTEPAAQREKMAGRIGALHIPRGFGKPRGKA